MHTLYISEFSKPRFNTRNKWWLSGLRDDVRVSSLCEQTKKSMNLLFTF